MVARSQGEREFLTSSLSDGWSALVVLHQQAQCLHTVALQGRREREWGGGGGGGGGEEVVLDLKHASFCRLA